jgi:hypothetical protein
MRQTTTAGMRHDESKATNFMRYDAHIAVRAFPQWMPKNQTMAFACPAIREKLS